MNGHLYIVDSRLGAEDMSKPSHMCVQRFSDDYKTATDPYYLTCEFPGYGIGGSVQAAVVENGIYVLGADEYDPDSLYAGFLSTKDGTKPETPARTFVGLERVDVAADGTLTCTNLSDTLVGIPELGMDSDEIALAGCKRESSW